MTAFSLCEIDPFMRFVGVSLDTAQPADIVYVVGGSTPSFNIDSLSLGTTRINKYPIHIDT